jgi:hypothetical protein
MKKQKSKNQNTQIQLVHNKQQTKVSPDLLLEEAILKYQKPLSLQKLSQITRIELNSIKKIIESMETKFIIINTNLVYLKDKLTELCHSLSQEDILNNIRSKELAMIQETELMLIIKDHLPNQKKMIISSLDIERGQISLTKRLEKFFKLYPQYAYLSMLFNSKQVDIWYIKEWQCLYGFQEVFRDFNLVPGQILELGWENTEKQIEFYIQVSPEREIEIYEEGLKNKRLNHIYQQYLKSDQDLTFFLVQLLEIYANGFMERELEQLCKHISVSYEDAISVLTKHKFFYQENEAWYCKIAIKDALSELKNKYESANKQWAQAKLEMATSSCEMKVLEKEKEHLSDELNYIQNHYREEQALYQQKLSELASQYEHLSQEHERSKREVDKLKKLEANFKGELDLKSQQLIELRQEKNKLKIKVETLQMNNSQLHKEMSEIRELAEKEILYLQREMREKNLELESLQYANGELQKNLGRFHEEKRQLKRRLNVFPIRIILFFMDLFSIKRKEDTKNVIKRISYVHKD